MTSQFYPFSTPMCRQSYAGLEGVALWENLFRFRNSNYKKGSFAGDLPTARDTLVARSVTCTGCDPTQLFVRFPGKFNLYFLPREHLW